jgi:hypothetical protein
VAQYVHVEIEMEPGAGLPGSLNNTPAAEANDGRMVLHMTADSTGDAVRAILDSMHEDGVFVDGPITITARKERQIGGDDGVMFLERNGSTGFKVTAPRPAEGGEE